MSFRYCESFDDVANWGSFTDERGWTQVSEGTGADGSFPTTEGRRGGGAFKITGLTSANNSFPRRLVTWTPAGTSTHSSLLFGFAFKFSAALNTAGAYPLIAILNSDAETVAYVQFTYSAGWYLQYYAGAARFSMALGGAPAAGDWHYIECSVSTFSTTATGIVKLGLNGVYSTSGSVITADPVYAPVAVHTLQLGTSGAAATLSFGYSGGSGNAWYDDLYVGLPAGSNTNITDLVGDTRVDILRPTGDGNSEQFTPLSGTDSFAMVDETDQDGDTSYIASNTAGHKTDFTFADLSHSPTSVYGFMTHAVARRDVTGARTLRQYKRYSSTDTEASALFDLTLTSTYAPQHALWENYDAGLARAYTPTEFNTLGFGVKVQS